MSDHDKMVAFGTWLGSRRIQLRDELYLLTVNANRPEAALRVKAGQIEAMDHIFGAFRELYNGDLNKFNESYLGVKPEDDKESDVPYSED